MAWHYGILSHMETRAEPTRKITVHLPVRLLEDSELGATELIRNALEQYRRIRKQRAFSERFGKVNWTLPYEQIKAERE